MTRIPEILNKLFLNSGKNDKTEDLSVFQQMFDYEAGAPEDTVEFSAEKHTSEPQKKKHTVKKGDTLSGLAQKYNTTSEAIKKENKLKSDQINIGETLVIPVPSQLKTVKTENSEKQKKLPKEITVQKDDTIESLAGYLGITAAEFKKAYGVEKITKGQLLTLKEQKDSKTSKAADTSTKTKQKLPAEITVQKDDTIKSLATYLGITVEEFKAAYGVEKITKGQLLTLKEQKTSNSSTTSAAADTPAKKDIDGFLYALRVTESTDNYSAKNGSGYIGAYQFGESALADLGIYKEKNKDYDTNDWVGIVKKNDFGITSISGFLSSKKQQDAVMKAMIDQNWTYIKNLKLEKYVGKTYAGVKITVSGMIAGAHLVGIGGLKIFLESKGNTVPKDGNGVPITDYIRDFSGYDLGLK